MNGLALPLVLLGNLNNWGIPALYAVGGALGVVVAAAILYHMLRLVLPKTAAIALATGKEASLQPVFYVLLVVGVTALLIFPYIPYNTFGEDLKMLKDSGLNLILVLSIIMALWTASISVADEIEGRTALTLLSKPITRRQFVLGKFLGIIGSVAIMFIVLGAVFLVTVSFKTVYEAKEGALPTPTAAQCSFEILQVVPGLILAFLETVVMTAVSVAISTRLPMLANLTICGAIYVLGHLVPALVSSVGGRFEIVAFVGRLIGILLPVLDHFNVQAAVATGAVVPPAYLGWALLYCTLYSAAAIFVALIMFEDRDLA